MGIVKFIKNWTLPVSMTAGAVIYLIFYFVPELDGIGNSLAPLMNEIVPLFMFFILYVTFCRVDFKKLIPVRWHFWTGLFQVLFVAIIVGVILALHVSGDNLILLEAILACIIGPCAAAAAVVTAKLGGNLEEMTTYTFLSNILCALLIPVCFPLIEPSAHMTFWSAFWIILNKVCVVLIVPMALAFITKHAPFLRGLYHKILAVADLGFYLWGCSLMVVTGTTVKNIVHAETSAGFLCLVAFLGLVLCLVQFAVGRYIGHFFDASVESGQGLGQKNTAFAIWIANTYLNPVSTIGPGCYILWQNIINSLEIWDMRRRQSRSKG